MRVSHELVTQLCRELKAKADTTDHYVELLQGVSDYLRNMATLESRAVEILKAIRGCKVVGRGTCSVVDESMSDDEVLDHLALTNKTSVNQALGEMRSLHKAHKERQREVVNA